MDQATLKGETLTLRPVERNDQQKVFEGFSHPEVTKYMDVTYPTFEATNEQMEWYDNNRKNGVGYAWVMENNAGQFMGVISIYHLHKTYRKCELGYWLLPDFWQKGHTSAALALLLPHLRQQYNIHRVSAEIEPDNVASKALLSRFGFKCEGVLQDFEFRNGRFNNLEIWALIFPEN